MGEPSHYLCVRSGAIIPGTSLRLPGFECIVCRGLCVSQEESKKEKIEYR